MDALADQNSLQIWLTHYGSFALFFLLAVGILALPVPEETLMVIAGALIHHGELPMIYTIIAALLGSMCGITCSYFVGWSAGHFIVQRYGSWIGIGKKEIDKGHAWFERFGKWTLLIGYFIPGVRHFTGLIAGMTELKFKEFALFAYCGAILWVSTFLSIGYFFGSYCLAFCETLEIGLDDVLTLLLILAITFLIYFLYKIKKIYWFSRQCT